MEQRANADCSKCSRAFRYLSCTPPSLRNFFPAILDFFGTNGTLEQNLLFKDLHDYPRNHFWNKMDKTDSITFFPPDFSLIHRIVANNLISSL